MLHHRFQRHAIAGQRDAERLRDRGRDHVLVADGRERHEVDAVREVVECLGGDLQAEPRLTDSSRARQREQPRALEQMLGPRHNVVSADEAGELGGQVVGGAVERAQGWECVGDAIDDELEETLGLGKVAQAVVAEVAQGQLRGEAAAHQRLRGRGDEDLPAVRGRGDAGRMVDVETDVLVAHQRRLARMQSDAHPDRSALRPCMFGKGPLRAGGSLASVEGAREDAEERVALRPELPAVVAAKRVAKQFVMHHLQRHVLVAELSHQPSRAFDVGEEECNGAGRQGHGLACESDGDSSGSSACARSARCCAVSKLRNGSSRRRVSWTLP